MPSAALKTYSELTPLEWRVWRVVTDLDDRRAYPTTRLVCQELADVRRPSVRGARIRLIRWGLVPIHTPAPRKPKPVRLRVVHPLKSEPFAGEISEADAEEITALRSGVLAKSAARFARIARENERKHFIEAMGRTPLDRMSSHSWDDLTPRDACREIVSMLRREKPCGRPKKETVS